MATVETLADLSAAYLEGYRFVPARPDEATVSTLEDDPELDRTSANRR